MQGKALKYGDNINTDVIIPGKYTKTLDMFELASHVMEDLDPHFRNKLSGEAFLVAGRNFGCGSSREQAPLALRHAGVACVAARSFARIFYRNAINTGLALIETDTDKIADGDMLCYTPGDTGLQNLTTGEILEVKPLPPIMVEILSAGGIVPYLRQHGQYRL